MEHERENIRKLIDSNTEIKHQVNSDKLQSMKLGIRYDLWADSSVEDGTRGIVKSILFDIYRI